MASGDPAGFEFDGTVGVVTGASGFLGRAVLRHLPARCTVYATYRTAEDFPKWAEGCAAEVHPVRIDLARNRLSERVPQVDWALLMAARVATAASWQDPLGELEAVAGVTFNSAVGLRADRLVHLSSGSVYEGLSGMLNPDRALAPRLPYSVAKLTAELLFGSYAEAPYWNVRFFGAFGPGEPSFKLARRLVTTFARGERSFELSGDGGNLIDPMYVEEAAARLCSTIEAPGESRAVDLSQGECLTVRQFAETAYAAAHPSPHEAPLELVCSGSAHELMRGCADTEPVIWRRDIEHITIAEGFERYTAHLAAR